MMLADSVPTGFKLMLREKEKNDILSFEDDLVIKSLQKSVAFASEND
jgi:hypothetical protein